MGDSRQLVTRRNAIVAAVALIVLLLIIGGRADERTTTLRTAGASTGVPADADPGGPALDELDADDLPLDTDDGDVDVEPGPLRYRDTLRESSSASFRCQFDQLADEVRTVRRADGARLVRASGWWRNGTCPRAVAEVTVQLQVKDDDGRWRDVGEPTTVTSSSRRAERVRATAAEPCARSADGAREWRSVTDVDLVDRSDGREPLISPAARLSCAPPG